jgi:uncharacterized protein
MSLTPSRYNLPIRDGGALSLLFNCRTGGMIRVPVAARRSLEELLAAEAIELERLPPRLGALVGGLAAAGFFVDDGCDELAAVRRRRAEGPRVRTLNLTVLPTMGCNLRCTYCYQVRQNLVMRKETRAALLAEVEARVRTASLDGIEVDWFGGEPLLAPRVIRELSAQLMALAARHGLSYRATMATNGSLLGPETVDMLIAAGLEEVQITLDGPPEVHDRRRPRAGGGGPTFAAVMRGILAAAERLTVVVRINVDRDTVDDAWRVLDLLEAAGCFAPGRSVQPYIASTGPLSAVCSHTCNSMLPTREFFDRVLAFQEEVLARRPDLDPGRLLGLPRPLERACGAHSELSLCVHPSGRVYKCGLEVHDPARAAGRLGEPFESHPNYAKWVGHDPFRRPECLRCRFLPLCLGGCIKADVEPSSPYHGEACVFFHHYLEPTLKLFARAQARRPV